MMKHLVFALLAFTLLIAVHAQSDAVIRASFLNGTTSTPYQYKLWVPRGYTNARSWKLVVWLHGIGERGQANGAQLIRTPVLLAKDVVQNNYPCFILAPILATGSWGAAAVKSLIQHVSGEYNIDQGELRITGFSWGSFGTWASIMGNAGLFKKAVPIAGGPSGSNWAAVRPTQIWTFHGEADSTVSWTGTRDAVAALTADGQAVIFTHEPNRNHEDGYVWTNYPTAAWFLADNATSATIATSVATSAAPCVPACTGNARCNNGQCACPAGTFPLPNCLNQYIGPDPLTNEGQGSAHLVVIPTAVSAAGKVNSLEIFWGTVAPENPQFEFRLYTKDGASGSSDNFTLAFKQAFTTTDFRNDSAKTITLNPPVDVQRGQYVALINLGGRLNLPNNPSNNFGYWYISDQTYASTLGGKTLLSYWNGAPAWRALFTGTAAPTSPTVGPSATRASASASVSPSASSSSPLSNNSESVTDTESSASTIIASLLLVAALLLQ